MRVGPAVEATRLRGQPALALTDHGEIPCAWEFQEACHAGGIKPLFGAELYFVEDARISIEKNDKERFHLVAIAKNEIGLRNLFSLISDAWTENSFQEKRGLVDWALLEKYHEGIIILSGCFFNLIGQTFNRTGKETASAVLERYRSIFGDDFHIEVARHHVTEEEKIMAGLIRIAGWYGMTPVLTNDAHYLEPDDWQAHEVVMRTRYDHVIDFRAHSREYWLKSEEEMLNLGFPDEYLQQSVMIAEQCGTISLPRVAKSAGHRLPDQSSVDSLIASGLAAYPARFNYIDQPTARRHAREVLGEHDPAAAAVAQTIEGLPRSSTPDTGHVVYAFGRPLKEIIPLKRADGKIMTQWDKASCEKSGAVILPANSISLFQKLRTFFRS